MKRLILFLCILAISAVSSAQVKSVLVRKVQTAPTAPPSAPTLSLPADARTGVSIDTLLAWNASTGSPTKYHVQLDTNVNFTGTLKLNDSTLTVTYDSTKILTGNKTYYWRVRARNNTNTRNVTYATGFSTTENPLFESGKWENKFTDTWAKIAVTGGNAYSTQDGDGTYDDAVALLCESDGSGDVTTTGKVHTINQSSGGYYESAFLFRAGYKTSPDSLRTYQVNIRMLNTSQSYIQIGKWTGPFNSLPSYASLGELAGASAGVSDGDILSASMIGDTIKAYVNGTLKLTATDTTTQTPHYNSGYAGIAVWRNGVATATDWGWDSVSIAYTTPWSDWSSVRSFTTVSVAESIEVGEHTELQATSNNADQTTSSITTGSSGSTFVVFGQCPTGTTIDTITDSKGNAYSRIGSAIDNAIETSSIFYSQNASGGSSHTFTMHLSGSVVGVVYVVEVIHGKTAGILDKSPAGLDDATSPYTSNLTGTTSQDTELLLGFAATLTASGTETLTWGNSFTKLGETGNSAYYTGGSAWRRVTSAGSYQTTFTASGAETSGATSWIISLKQ